MGRLVRKLHEYGLPNWFFRPHRTRGLNLQFNLDYQADIVRVQITAICISAILVLPISAAAEIVVADDGDGGLVFANVLPTETAGRDGSTGESRRATKGGSSGGNAHRAALLARRRQTLEPLVADAAARHDLPEALLKAVIQVESNFDPGAVSPKGATGPMQLMPRTARDMGVRDIRDPAENIDGGARYLKELLVRFDHDLVMALAAYNAGPAAVERAGGRMPAYAETLDYVPKVVGHYHSYQAGARTSEP